MITKTFVCENITFKKGQPPQLSNMAALYENVQLIDKASPKVNYVAYF